AAAPRPARLPWPRPHGRPRPGRQGVAARAQRPRRLRGRAAPARRRRHLRARDAPRGPRLPVQARARRRRHRRTCHLARSHRRAMTEPTVSYPLRDILREIRQELAAINIKLDDKASRSDVLELKARLDAEVADLTSRVDKLESIRDRLIGVALAMGGVAGGVASVVANSLGA